MFKMNTKVAVSWGARHESLEKCAERLVSCLVGLEAIDTRFSTWTPNFGKRTVVNVSDAKQISDLLIRGQNRRDVGGAVIQELGYSIELVVPNSLARMMLVCGSYSRVKGIGNNCNLTIDRSIAASLGVDGHSKVLAKLVDSWQPESGSVYVFVSRVDDVDKVNLIEWHQNGAIYRNEMAIRQYL